MHNAGRGPVYTSRRRPVELAYYEEMPSKTAAVQREKQIKKWSRSKKQALISGYYAELKNLSHNHKR
jgi:putative endonuclease